MADNDCFVKQLDEKTVVSDQMFIGQCCILRPILDSMGDGLVVMDNDGRFQLFNPKAREIFNIADLIDEPYAWTENWTDRYGVQLLLPDGITPYPLSQFPLLRAVNGEKIDRAEVRLRKQSSPDLIWLSITARPLVDSENITRGAVAVIRDITKRMEAEQRLVQSERLAAIGELVAGVAHESRNALQQIQACCMLLKWQYEGNGEAGELIEDLQKAQHRLSGLFEDLRGYAAPVNLDLKPCDLPAIVDEAWSALASAREGRDATLLEHFSARNIQCQADRLRLEQVFRNILENALEACEDPVLVEVEISDAVAGNAPAVCVAIRDNGSGFKPAQQLSAFRPFYTTKTTGTGLGMCISKRIVEAHQGKITLGNHSAGGAEVRIVLPRKSR